MKTILFLTVFALLAIWVVRESKTLEIVPYTERAAGVVPVQKSRYEWHPERLMPFIQEIPKKGIQRLKGTLDRSRERSSPEESGVIPREGFERIRLKDGTEILGRIVEEKGGFVWIEVEGGKIAFKRDEIASPSY